MRGLRDAAGLSQREAEALLGVTSSTLTSPEQKGTRISYAKLLERAEALGVELDIRARRRTP